MRLDILSKAGEAELGVACAAKRDAEHDPSKRNASPSLPIAFIPVHFGYDRVFEVNSYLSELEG